MKIFYKTSKIDETEHCARGETPLTDDKILDKMDIVPF